MNGSTARELKKTYGSGKLYKQMKKKRATTPGKPYVETKAARNWRKGEVGRQRLRMQFIQRRQDETASAFKKSNFAKLKGLVV